MALAELAKMYGPWLTPGAIIVSSLVAAIIAFIVIAQQRAIARKQVMIQALFNKNWDRDYIETRSKFVGLREDRNALVSAAMEQNQTGDDASIIRSVLNDYEITALGIKCGILDEAIFKLWFKTTFLIDCEKTRPFVEEVRRRNPRAFVELEALAKSWKNQSD